MSVETQYANQERPIKAVLQTAYAAMEYAISIMARTILDAHLTAYVAMVYAAQESTGIIALLTATAEIV